MNYILSPYFIVQIWCECSVATTGSRLVHSFYYSCAHPSIAVFVTRTVIALVVGMPHRQMHFHIQSLVAHRETHTNNNNNNNDRLEK